MYTLFMSHLLVLVLILVSRELVLVSVLLQLTLTKTLLFGSISRPIAETISGVSHIYSVGGSSDAGFRCQYCSNCFIFPEID